jgi:hypothetical protein
MGHIRAEEVVEVLESRFSHVMVISKHAVVDHQAMHAVFSEGGRCIADGRMRCWRRRL